ncbi:cupin domain-containing protein [Pontixanthobacter gangjinensis]|uniref:Cupin domain-containing protein n=1 Tax=Christiangramia aestuarii TaxID=1028746 RepID=A0A7K1LPH7_9FLAO|nr:cupin domain-containing protein [Christiangramia aestuarii]MUP42470.1 cupin domain-containing protein [Christiangramia aestuarii]
MNKLEKIIARLDLQPHPEGGFFRETYRSEGEISQSELGEAYSGKRNFSTCIYFLLTSEAHSNFHRIKQDEIWHFYDGSPIRLHTISENGEHKEQLIGREVLNGETPQLVVKGGDWFAAEVINENDFSLVGCTVAPGFSFEDFELPPGKELLERFPQHERLITKFTSK